VTGCSAIGHLIAYMQYAESITINEEQQQKNSSKLLMIS
jgi:hypothetical protein